MTAAALPLGAGVASAGILGLAFGSFANVVVYRVPRGYSILRPGSACPTCNTELTPRDNVPVLSWLALRGRCRHCGGAISGRYPAVELAFALLFAGITAVVHTGAVPGLCAAAGTLVVLGAIEAEGFAAPTSVAFTGTALAAAGLGGFAVATSRFGPLVDAAYGVAAAGAAGLLIAIVGRARARRSDRRRARSTTADAGAAMVPAGAILGWLGAGPALIGCAAGALVVTGLAVLHLARARRGSGAEHPRAAVDPAVAGLVAAVAGLVALGAGAR